MRGHARLVEFGPQQRKVLTIVRLRPRARIADDRPLLGGHLTQLHTRVQWFGGGFQRHAMGIAVFFGMLGVTFFGLFLTPVFYVALRKLAGTPLVSHAEHLPAARA